MIAVKRLWLLRHAKSSWDDPGLPDTDRPLAPRGQRAAELLAAHLAASDIRPATVLCSSSLRTRETLATILPALGDALEIHIERELYGAGPAALLERLGRVPNRALSVMLIGHNPGIQYLALELGDHRAGTRCAQGEVPHRGARHRRDRGRTVARHNRWEGHRHRPGDPAVPGNRAGRVSDARSAQGHPFDGARWRDIR